MTIATEPIGSIPRPRPRVSAVAQHGLDTAILEPLFGAAARDTILGAP